MGWSCAVHGIPLVKETPYAWKYGPIYPEVYEKLKKYVGEHVQETICDPNTGEIYTASLSEPQQDLVKSTLNTYGKLHALELSNLTHQRGTPWDITVKTTGCYSPIPIDIIRMHYQSKLLKKRSKER